MTKLEFLEILTDIDEKYIAEAHADIPKKQPLWLRFGALAACLCVIVAGALFMLRWGDPAAQPTDPPTAAPSYGGAIIDPTDPPKYYGPLDPTATPSYAPTDAPETVSVFREVERVEGEQGSASQQIPTDGWTYEDYIDSASHVFRGTFVKYTDRYENGSYDLVFAVEESFKGDCPDEAYVHVVPANWTGEKYEEYNYIEGHEYILVTELHVRRDLDYDHYYPVGNYFIPLDDPLGAYIGYRPMTVGDLDADAVSQAAEQPIMAASLLGYTTEFCADSPTTEPASIPFTRTSDLAEAVRASGYVLRITVEEEWRADSGIYYCSVDETLLANDSRALPERIVVSFEIEVESGDSFCALLNRASGESQFFASSTPISLIADADADAVAALTALLGDS